MTATTSGWCRVRRASVFRSRPACCTREPKCAHTACAPRTWRAPRCDASDRESSARVRPHRSWAPCPRCHRSPRAARTQPQTSLASERTALLSTTRARPESRCATRSPAFRQLGDSTDDSRPPRAPCLPGTRSTASSMRRGRERRRSPWGQAKWTRSWSRRWCRAIEQPDAGSACCVPVRYDIRTRCLLVHKTLFSLLFHTNKYIQERPN